MITTRRIEEIETHPLFEGLFMINKNLLAKIEQNMREENYDDSQPIILGTWPGQDNPVCIDGHTRLKAATNVGIKEVFVCSYEFETEEGAFEYAVRLQSHRRILTDGDLIHCIQRLHEQKPRGGNRRSETAKESIPQSCGNENGRSAGAKRTAELLNISTRKVEQALTVINRGSPETKEAVLKNDISINKAYQKTQKDRKRAEAESSAEVLQGEIIDGEEEDDSKVSQFRAPVFISMEHFGALNELGGFAEEHVANAIELYLQSQTEQDERNPVASDQGDMKDEDDEEEWFYPEGWANEQGSEKSPDDDADSDEEECPFVDDNAPEEDDEEYFYPEDYKED
ncbi:hypothetical protein [Desulfomonile tiedjei]|nr:hypothetical protein [Desulfomonile tiedjei]